MAATCSTKQQIKMLLDAYVQRMFHREMESRAYRKLTPPKAEQIQHWLYFLAWQLQQESRTEFLIEQLQPSWLLVGKQERLYELIVGLIVGLVIALIFTFSSTLRGWLSYSALREYFGLNYVLTQVLVIWLISGLAFVMHTRIQKKIEVIEAFNFSFKEAKNSIIYSLILVLGFFFVMPLFFEDNREFLQTSIRTYARVI